MSQMGRVRESSFVSSRHSICPGAPLASAAIAQSLKRWLRGSPAPGYVSSTLIPAAGVAISSAPQRPECGRDREFSVWPSPTGNAALQPITPSTRLTASGRKSEFGAVGCSHSNYGVGRGPLAIAMPPFDLAVVGMKSPANVKFQSRPADRPESAGRQLQATADIRPPIPNGSSQSQAVAQAGSREGQLMAGIANRDRQFSASSSSMTAMWRRRWAADRRCATHCRHSRFSTERRKAVVRLRAVSAAPPL
jgi:hypothetical protein